MNIIITVYQHKETQKFRIADHPPGNPEEWVELYSFIHPTRDNFVLQRCYSDGQSPAVQKTRELRRLRYGKNPK